MAISTSEVVQKYLDSTGMTLRKFANELCESLVDDNDTCVTHATVINWRDGKTVPGTDFLTLMLLKYRDWRFDFALECLVAKRPEVWGADGIWQIATMLLPVAG